MKATELAVLLDFVGKAYVQGGLRKSAPPLNTLIKDLEAFGKIDLRDAVQRLRSGTKPVGTRKSSTKKSIPLKREVVSRYVSDLEAADSDRAMFMDCLGRLKTDKRVRAGHELTEILSQYSGGTLTGSTKTKRLGQLEAAFTVRQTKKRNRRIASFARPF